MRIAELKQKGLFPIPKSPDVVPIGKHLCLVAYEAVGIATGNRVPH